MSLSPRSLAALDGVHPVLDRLARAVAERAPPFLITEGRRTKERQAQLVKAKKSKTMNSRHITGHAIDFVAVLDGGRISYDDAHMRPIAGAFRDVAAEMGIKITRGIDWGWIRRTLSLTGQRTRPGLSLQWPKPFPHPRRKPFQHRHRTPCRAPAPSGAASSGRSPGLPLGQSNRCQAC